jgi:sorbitol-specific phosphotransferase system component IIA
LEWLAKDLRRIHNLHEPTSRKVLMAQLRVRHAHKTIMIAAVGDEARQNFHKAT